MDKKDEQDVWAVLRHSAPGITWYGYVDWDYGHFTVTFVTLRDDEPHGLGTAHPLDDLTLSAQYNASEGKPYGFDCYIDGRRVTLDFAKSVVKTLERIDRAYRKITDEWGCPQTFGAYMLYMLKAIKVKGILMDAKPNRSWGTPGEWRKRKVTDAEWMVAEALQPIMEKLKGESK